MSIITAYKSDEDGAIFEQEADYKKHLRKLNSARLKIKKQELAEIKKQEFFKSFKKDCTTFKELAKKLEENIEFLLTNNNPWNDKVPKGINAKILLTKEEIQWNSQQTEPWKKTKPEDTGGWAGKINMNFSQQIEFSSFSLLKNLDIHMATGGSSNHCEFNYGFTIQAKDWPVLSLNETVNNLSTTVVRWSREPEITKINQLIKIITFNEIISEENTLKIKKWLETIKPILANKQKTSELELLLYEKKFANINQIDNSPSKKNKLKI